MVEPCLLAREIEVALDIEAVSFTFMMLFKVWQVSPVLSYQYVIG
jgi:hypothetical protein